MPADVRAIDALREWLGALATYRSEAAEALGGFRLEIGRANDWVSEQMHLWQRAIRKCEDAVVQAKAELTARQFPDVNGRMPDTTVQERNLKRAKARLEHAQDKVTTCRKWLTQLPKVVDELFSGPANRLANTLEGDVPRGMAALERQIDALERYADLKTDYSTSPSIGAAPPAPPTAAGGAS